MEVMISVEPKRITPIHRITSTVAEEISVAGIKTHGVTLEKAAEGWIVEAVSEIVET